MGALFGAGVAAVLMPAVARACETDEGRPRALVWAYVLGVALVGALAAASRLPHALLGLLELFGPLTTLLLLEHGFKLFILFLVGAYLTDWFADRVERSHRLARGERYPA